VCTPDLRHVAGYLKEPLREKLLKLRIQWYEHVDSNRIPCID
jgi:hypothetical protein